MPENTTLPALPGSAFSRAKVAAWTPEAPVANYQLSVSEIIAAGKAGIYPDARLYVPRGVTASGVIVPGSGGADGTYALTWSGGNFTANPVGTFKVTGGRVMAVTITQPGLYVGASPTAPTATFTNSAGLSGASVPLTVDFLVNSGDAYWADHASDSDLYQLVRNVNGTATEMAGRTLPKNTDPIAGDIATVAGLSATATTQAGIATTQANAAINAKADTQAIAGLKGVYATKADANTALAGLAADTLVLVQADETQGGASWYYQKTGGVYVSKGAANNRGPLIVPINVTPATSTGVTIFEVKNDEALTNSAGGNDAVRSAFQITVNYSTQGPTGHVNYYNRVMGFGHNINGSWGSLDGVHAAASSRIEFKFAQGGPTSNFGAEFHCASLIPVGGGEHRAITAFVAHDKTKWHTGPDGSAVALQAAVVTLNDGRSIARVSHEFTDTGASPIHYTKGNQVGSFAPQIYFDDNNRTLVQQINVAGNAYLAHPYYDNNEAFKLNAGTLVVNGAAKTSSITALTAMLSMSSTAMAAGGHMAYLNAGGAITGNLSGLYMQCAVSGYAENSFINTTSAGKFGTRIRTTAGTMFHEFHDNTGNRHIGFTYYPGSGGSLALDDAQQGGQFASKNAFTVDYSTFQTRFGYAPRLVSSTVANLPAAATAGAGSIQYVTNLNATTAGTVAAGGGSNKGVVVCDGTDWRIMTAW